MSSQIDISFDDARLRGVGTITVEKGQLYADGPFTVERADVLYIELDNGVVVFPDAIRHRDERLPPGAYVVARGGLYKRVLPP